MAIPFGTFRLGAFAAGDMSGLAGCEKSFDSGSKPNIMVQLQQPGPDRGRLGWSGAVSPEGRPGNGLDGASSLGEGNGRDDDEGHDPQGGEVAPCVPVPHGCVTTAEVAEGRPRLQTRGMAFGDLSREAGCRIDRARREGGGAPRPDVPATAVELWPTGPGSKAGDPTQGPLFLF